MVTRTHVSNAKQTIQLPAPHKVSMFGLALAVIFILALAGLAFSFIAPQVIAGRVENRAMQAWAGRYQGLANDYAKPAAANAAWAARYQGLADAYTIKTTSANAAYAARYQGLANLEATHSMP